MDIDGLLADVRTVTARSAVWGMWEGRGSMDGSDVIDEVADNVSGVKVRADIGSDDYWNNY